MSRRIAIGTMPDGSFDARIARPGFDALYDDVNDRTKISFAASRATFGRVAEAGTIGVTDTWVPLQQTYTDTPRVILVLNRGGFQALGVIDRVTWSQGGLAVARDGSTYVALVEANRIMVTRAINNAYRPGIVAGDTFSYFLVR